MEICPEITGPVQPQNYSRPRGGARPGAAQWVQDADRQERRQSLLRQEKSKLDAACLCETALVPRSAPRHHHHRQVGIE